jgi:hypothetical protein
VDPAASSILQSTWVKIVGIPGFAKEEEVVKEIASLVGEPIKVDEFSLIRDEPVRVRVNCRNPATLRGFIEIFFNGVGFDIRCEAESLQGRNQGKGSGPGGSGGGDDQQKETKIKIRIKMIIVTKERTRVLIIKKNNLILIRIPARGSLRKIVWKI